MMTETQTRATRNEAAERLHAVYGSAFPRHLLDEALAAERRAVEQEYEQRILTLRETADRATARADAERRATVERIRERLLAVGKAQAGSAEAAILDEEAAASGEKP
jgi:predicted metal-dependent phosphoesterase TrpH